MEEKIAHNKEYMGSRLDEVIRQQKVANGRVGKLEAGAEKFREHLTEETVRDKNLSWIRRGLYVVLVLALPVMGAQVKDHFTIKDLRRHSVSDSAFYYMRADFYRLYQENAKDIKELKKDSEAIDEFLREKFGVHTVRGKTLADK